MTLQESCEASGVPLRLEDEAAAAQIARILRTEHEAREKLVGYNERALAAYDEMRREPHEEF